MTTREDVAQLTSLLVAPEIGTQTGGNGFASLAANQPECLTDRKQRSETRRQSLW